MHMYAHDSNGAPCVFTPLSLNGCGLPGRTGSAATFIRQATFQELWRQMAGQPEQQAILIATINAYEQASWWVVHQRQAATLVRDQVIGQRIVRQVFEAQPDV